MTNQPCLTSTVREDIYKTFECLKEAYCSGKELTDVQKWFLSICGYRIPHQTPHMDISKQTDYKSC